MSSLPDTVMDVQTSSRHIVTFLVLIMQIAMGVVPMRGVLCVNQGVCALPAHLGSVEADALLSMAVDAEQEAQDESPCCGRCMKEDGQNAGKAVRASTLPPVHDGDECPPGCNCCFEMTTQHTSLRPLTLSMGAALELTLAASLTVSSILPLSTILESPCTAPFGLPPPEAPMQCPAVGLSTDRLII